MSAPRFTQSPTRLCPRNPHDVYSVIADGVRYLLRVGCELQQNSTQRSIDQHGMGANIGRSGNNRKSPNSTTLPIKIGPFRTSNSGRKSLCLHQYRYLYYRQSHWMSMTCFFRILQEGKILNKVARKIIEEVCWSHWTTCRGSSNVNSEFRKRKKSVLWL